MFILFIFSQGHTIVGAGTTSQLTAMLTGVPEKDQPEARKGWSGASYVDRWNFIFKNLAEKNYVTTLSEHDMGTGAFHMRLKGFNKPPCDYFVRSLWLNMGSLVDQELSCAHQFNLRYAKDFFDAHRGFKKFAFVFNCFTHNTMDRIENADDDMKNFLLEFEKSEHGQNTIVFLGGDHGLRSGSWRATIQGKLEERLPLLAVKVPSRFSKSFKKEMDNLRRNSQILTSHFDLYPTFHHLSTFPQFDKKRSHKYGESLFSDISKLNRTCADAGVEKHWCTCLNYAKVNPEKDENVKKLIGKVIEYINKRNKETAPDQCAVLELKSVETAGRRTPNAEVNMFKDTRTRAGQCASCDVVYDRSKKFTRFRYEVSFTVAPSDGMYEAEGDVVVQANGSVDVRIDTEISRTNLYRDQPKCIVDTFPSLRPYCYCNDFVKP